MEDEIVNKKICRICRSYKPLTNFQIRDKSSGKLRNECNPCANEQKRIASLARKGKESKQCSRCKRTLDILNFRTRGGKQKHLLNSRCKDCCREMHKDWCSRNPERVKEYRKADEWTLYKRCQRRNISPDDFFKAVEAQENKCPVCNQELGEITETAIDHNHDTGEFRGVLHKECNRGLGLFKDNPETLRRAAEYLESKGYYGV